MGALQQLSSLIFRNDGCNERKESKQGHVNFLLSHWQSVAGKTLEKNYYIVTILLSEAFYASCSWILVKWQSLAYLLEVSLCHAGLPDPNWLKGEADQKPCPSFSQIWTHWRPHHQLSNHINCAIHQTLPHYPVSSVILLTPKVECSSLPRFLPSSPSNPVSHSTIL